VEFPAHDNVGIDHRVRDVMALISSLPQRPWTLELLANSVNVSPCHLDRHFRKYAATSPMAVLKAKRMELAADLLFTTNSSVKQIATGVGIADLSHFVKDFEAKYVID